MLRTDDASAVAQVRGYFDELGYSYVLRFSSDLGTPLLYPEFDKLQNFIKLINPIYGVAYALFRQGHPADDDVLRRALAPRTFEAMVETGLLVRNARRQWQTPGLIVTPVEGLYVVSSTPPQYPTAPDSKHSVYLGIDSMWLVSALPAHLSGRRVLDVCAGSGIQGLVCAARGAARVVGLEKSEPAAQVARFNAALNGFGDGVVEIRQSDLYSALGDDEEFDFFVSNPPFIPMSDEMDYPLAGAGGPDGTRVMRGIMAGLPRHLAPRAEGFLFCNALGSRYSISFNDEVLRPFAEEHGFLIRAWVSDKFTTASYMNSSMDINLRNTCPEIPEGERRRKIGAWFEDLKVRGVPADYTYTQVLHFTRAEGRAGLVTLPFYNPISSDPLVALTQMPGSRAR